MLELSKIYCPFLTVWRCSRALEPGFPWCASGRISPRLSACSSPPPVRGVLWRFCAAERSNFWAGRAES